MEEETECTYIGKYSFTQEEIAALDKALEDVLRDDHGFGRIHCYSTLWFTAEK